LDHGTDGAQADVNGDVLLIAETRLLPQEEMSAAPPGTVLSRDENGVVVQCGDGPIQILAWNRVEAGL
jgi:methionyl-tRNA formyltransferase